MERNDNHMKKNEADCGPSGVRHRRSVYVSSSRIACAPRVLALDRLGPMHTRIP